MSCKWRYYGKCYSNSERGCNFYVMAAWTGWPYSREFGTAIHPGDEITHNDEDTYNLTISTEIAVYDEYFKQELSIYDFIIDDTSSRQIEKLLLSKLCASLCTKLLKESILTTGKSSMSNSSFL